MRDWQRIESALARTRQAKPALGAVHLGLTDGITVSEGAEPLARIALHALTFETVWLPGPGVLLSLARRGQGFRVPS
jgi:hypothetical protein